MENHENIMSLFTLYEEEYTKFKSGNKAAGTRARKALSEIGKLCKEIRQDIQAEKNADK